MDIIFHIGMPKCASTTLQNKAFFGAPGYLGTGERVPWSENYAKRFQFLAPIGPRFRGNLKAAHRWSRDVLDFGRQWPNLPRFLLSSELLTNRNRFHPRPIVPFLKQMSEEVWVHGRVKVIIVLRNPAERLASAYAQDSAGIFGASQLYFEWKVDRILRRELVTLDVASWVSELFDALGKENVCVLLMEDIGRIEFWQTLKEFALLDEFDPEEMLGSMVMNKRKAAANIWQLSPFDFWSRARSQAEKVVGFMWPGGRSPGVRRKVIFSVAHGLSALHKISPARLRERERGTTIVLTEELRQRVNDKCRPIHQRLSRLLDRDLADSGY